jgi:hypothetical protein
MQELLNGADVVLDSVEYIQGSIKKGLLELFEKQNIHIQSNSNLLEVDYRQFVGAKRVRKVKTSKGSETLNGLTSRIEKTLAKGL